VIVARGAVRVLGGVNPDGTPWRLRRDEAIAGIEAGRLTLHVEVEGRRRAAVVVVRDVRGRKRLATKDDQGAGALLALASPRSTATAR
jgi:Protein of unknown function (DUF3892)